MDAKPNTTIARARKHTWDKIRTGVQPLYMQSRRYRVHGLVLLRRSLRARQLPRSNKGLGACARRRCRRRRLLFRCSATATSRSRRSTWASSPYGRPPASPGRSAPGGTAISRYCLPEFPLFSLSLHVVRFPFSDLIAALLLLTARSDELCGEVKERVLTCCPWFCLWVCWLTVSAKKKNLNSLSCSEQL